MASVLQNDAFTARHTHRVANVLSVTCLLIVFNAVNAHYLSKKLCNILNVYLSKPIFVFMAGFRYWNLRDVKKKKQLKLHQLHTTYRNAPQAFIQGETLGK